MAIQDRQKYAQRKEDRSVSTATSTVDAREMLPPGSAAPQHGIYECGCAQRHQFLTTTAGDVLPQLATDCIAASWRLIEPDPA